MVVYIYLTFVIQLSVKLDKMKKKNPDVDYDKPLEKKVPEQILCSSCEAEMNNTESSPGNDTDVAVGVTTQTTDNNRFINNSNIKDIKILCFLDDMFAMNCMLCFTKEAG